MSTESYLKEETDYKSFKIKKETNDIPVMKSNDEIVKNVEDCNLLRNKDDPKDLESVQKYAHRIKSFLGWEPNFEDKEQEKKPVVNKHESDTTNVTQNLPSSSLSNEYIDKRNQLPDDKLDAVEVALNNDEDECEIILESMKNDDVSDEELNRTVEDVSDEIKVTDKKEDSSKAIENSEKNLEYDLFDCKNDIVENTNILCNSDETDRANNYKTDDLSFESVLENANRDLMQYKNNDTCASSIEENLASELNNSTPSKDIKEDKINTSSTSETTENCILDENLLNDINENKISERNVESLVDVPEENLSNAEDEKESKILLSPNVTSSENLINDFTNDEDQNNDIDDLRSEDSLDLYETVPKNFVKEIRRLSRGIVKEVIDSARSSIHEIFVNEDGAVDITLENLPSCDLVKDNQEFYFQGNEEPENIFSDFPETSNQTSLSLKFNNFSEETKDKVVGKLYVTDEDNICCYGCFKPRCFQRFATPRVFLAFFAIIGLVHGCYYTYIVSIMSTLEKKFAFTAKVSGAILLSDELAPSILGVFVGYFGGKTHRPRMVAAGMFLSAICCFIYGLPYFIYDTEKHLSNLGYKNKTGHEICESSVKKIDCGIDQRPPTLEAVSIFILASFLKGFASSTYYVLGMSYMDDIIKKKNSPMYFAIALALRLLGPLVGFLMSSGFLKYYENPAYDPGFGPDDPRWIGAWWIGFFLQGILLAIFTIPIALFPRRLPSQRKIEKIAATDSEDGLKEIFAGLISALKRLVKNPVFIVLIINTTMKIFGHFGHAIMLPKYMENQFRLSASEASLFSGASTIVCIIISTILGGFLIWKFRPGIKVILASMIVSETILSIGYLVLMIPRCQVSEMLNFGMNEEGLILKSVCNRNCDCSTSSFTPFCGPDGKTLYFSPCYAGCTEVITLSLSPKVIKEFDNCSCVEQQQLGTTVSEGFCPDENCWSQTIAYLVILFFLVTISNLFTVAATMILLRSVHPNDKSVALGTFETFICLFGFIPFPVIYGALVDSACLVWEKSCGETGNCWFYDMEKYNYSLHGASALFCSLSVVCLITLYFLSSRIRNLYDEEEEEDEKAKYPDIKLDTVSGCVTKL